MADKCPEGATWELVKCGSPTKPPHKREKTPGTCSRTKGFCVPPTPDWTCWQHGKDYVLVKNPRHFKDCADAVDTFNKEAAQGLYEANTQPFVRYTSSTPKLTKTNGQWTASTALRWSVDASKTVVNLPEITWDNMSDADKAAVKRATDALLAHEEGHVQLAVDYAAELSANGGDKISATGATQQAARDALKERMADRTQEVVAELGQRNSTYDDTTEHGQKQSNLPGGVDAQLDCPE